MLAWQGLPWGRPKNLRRCQSGVRGRGLHLAWHCLSIAGCLLSVRWDQLPAILAVASDDWCALPVEKPVKLNRCQQGIMRNSGVWRQKERIGHVLMIHQVACTWSGCVKHAVHSLQFCCSLPALRGFSSGGVGVEDFIWLDIVFPSLVACSVFAEISCQRSLLWPVMTGVHYQWKSLSS